MLTKISVLLLVEIPNKESTFECASSKDSRRVRCPLNVTNGVLKIKGHHWSSDLHIPHLDSPIGRTRDEDSRMELVPLDSINTMIMAFISFKILS